MSSAIPAALDAITTALRTALPLVDVYDGPTLDGGEATPEDNIWRRVFISETPDEEVSDDLVFDRSWASLGTSSMDEQVEIEGYLDCVSGDEPMLPLRTAAFDLLDDISAAVDSVDFVGIQEPFAVFGRGSMRRIQDEKGAGVVLRFVITGTVRITTT